MKTRKPCLVAVLSIGFVTALAAQEPPATTSGTDHATAIMQSLQTSMVALREFQWVETTVVSLKERERLTLHESTAAAEAERAKVDLFRAMGSSDFPVSAGLAEVPARPTAGLPLSVAALLQLARDRPPELRLAAAANERARAELELQFAQAKPDWTVSVGYKRNSGFDTVLASVSVPLPFFNRNQGNVSSGTAEVNRSENLEQMTLRQVEGEVASALAALRRRHEMVAQLDRGMLKLFLKLKRKGKNMKGKSLLDSPVFLNPFSAEDAIRAKEKEDPTSP